MARYRADLAAAVKALPPLRAYWRAIYDSEREEKQDQRLKQKARDQRKPRCNCAAYRFPHRLAGGLCRYPDAPLLSQSPPSTLPRRRLRYRGLLRQIARSNGLHPIRDKDVIAGLMPEVMRLAKDLHAKHPRIKYRNLEIKLLPGNRLSLTGWRNPTDYDWEGKRLMDEVQLVPRS